MTKPTEQQKVQALYHLIGERGLYVNTNYDIFTKKPEDVPLGTAYKIPLIQNGSKAYASPLLFAALTSLLNHGTILITGAPGIGKTTGAEFAGHFFTGTPLEEILSAEIQGHPQLTEEKMVASYDIGKLLATPSEKIVIPTRFLECPVKILDEGTRTPPDVLSIIMRLVDTGKAVYGGKLLKAKPGPLFVTANYADEGTFHFTPPFLDRFDVAVIVTSPKPADLRKIRERGDEKLTGDLEKCLTIPEDLKLDFEKIRREISNISEARANDVPVVSSFADFLYGSLRFSEVASDSLARSTKGNAWYTNQDNAPPGHFRDAPFTYTLNELSVRTVRAMQRYAKAFAWFTGKDEVDLGDFKTVLPYLLWHKIQPSSKALTENTKFSNDRISFIEELLEKIENDYSELAGSDALKLYSSAMNVLRTGKIKDKDLNQEDIRNIVRNAISRLGGIDKPYAITLATHIASEFNSRFNGVKR